MTGQALDPRGRAVPGDARLSRDAPRSRRSCDVAVIGAGIVGLATARELLLRDRRARVVVIEREPRIAAHQSSHNSGVIHAGVYYEPGSLKARLCVEGARELYDYCARRGIPHERCGKLIVAVDRGELARLDELERRAAANGVRAERLAAARSPRSSRPARASRRCACPTPASSTSRAWRARSRDDVREARRRRS